MKGKKITGIALIAVGIVIVVLMPIADQIGIGSSVGFGLQQKLGMFVGGVVTGGGAVIALNK
jgi:hypothetical protein